MKGNVSRRFSERQNGRQLSRHECKVGCLSLTSGQLTCYCSTGSLGTAGSARSSRRPLTFGAGPGQESLVGTGQGRLRLFLGCRESAGAEPRARQTGKGLNNLSHFITHTVVAYPGKVGIRLFGDFLSLTSVSSFSVRTTESNISGIFLHFFCCTLV